MTCEQKLQFDIESWRRHLALSRSEVQTRIDWTICGPAEVVAVECMRDEARRLGDFGANVPCDIHVFVAGEAPRRDATKVGGVPYRPRTLPWPGRRDGTPMVFVCQFSFGESLDLFRGVRLPGDVLLVFAPEAYPSLEDDGTCFELEWYPKGLADLVESDCLPAEQDTFPHRYYGLRHRSTDYTMPEPGESLIERAMGRDKYGRQHVGRPVRVWNATKIGGIPFSYSDDDARPATNGTYLCSLAPISRDSTIADAASFKLNDRDYQDLCWYDGFELQIFLAPDNSTFWKFEIS